MLIIRSIVNAGRSGGTQPKRYYKFALVDPLDAPFVSFRYYYRTWEQMQYLGLLEEDESSEETESEFSVIEPETHTPTRGEKSKAILSGQGLEDVFGWASLYDGSVTSQSSKCEIYVPAGAPGSKKGGCGLDEAGVDSQQEVYAPPRAYRLSIPPSLRLEPPRPPSRPLPSIPRKIIVGSSTSYQHHPAYPLDEWDTRTPSPVKSIREGITTPPMGEKRSFTPTSLVGAVVKAWKRRANGSSDRSSEDDGRTASRNTA